ncbi:MAG: histidine phosphatase family protein [Nitrosopumilus sp. H8]|nr:MAG: histidine phosphatase family protein [Nitrosopumilus sp. H8]
MGQIIFARHGQAQNNVDRVLAGRTKGIPLTAAGIKQARHAAKMLQKMNVSAVYSSPIQRAQETAEIMAKGISEVRTDDRLIELDMGKFTGMPYDEIFGSHGNVFLKFYRGELEVAHNGVETFAEVKGRVQGMVRDALKRHPDQNVLFVTHMDPIKAMISTVLDLSPENLFEMVITNASLNIFGEKEGGFSMGGLNVMDPSRFGAGRQ